MGGNVRARKKDSNHDLIAEAFRKCGWYWIDTYQFAYFKPGWFDGMAIRNGIVLGVEIKAGKGILTPDEEAFHREWPGPIVIVRNIEDVLALTEEW